MELRKINRFVLLVVALSMSIVIVACTPESAVEEKPAVEQARRAAISVPKQDQAAADPAESSSEAVTAQQEAAEEVIERVGDLLSSPAPAEETSNVGGIIMTLDDMLNGADNAAGNDAITNDNVNDNGGDDADDNDGDDDDDNDDDDADDNDDDDADDND
ncbi:MAG: hypothetical protein GWP61_03040, partial [Chloroflexi bacterium]|nr:hypothetical protein [Chloroflexota bacterium]